MRFFNYLMLLLAPISPYLEKWSNLTCASFSDGLKPPTRKKWWVSKFGDYLLLKWLPWLQVNQPLNFGVGVQKNGPVGGNDHLSWKRKLIFPATLQGTNISPKNGILKMIFLFPRWDMLIPWRVPFQGSASFMECNTPGGGDGTVQPILGGSGPRTCFSG